MAKHPEAHKKNPFTAAARLFTKVTKTLNASQKKTKAGSRIGEPNSPVKPRTEKALRRLLRKKGISQKEFDVQFRRKR